jgi:preprotein translocase subunit SecA
LFRAFRGLPKYSPVIKFLSEPGVKVKMQKAENFYLQDQMRNMHIVDEELLFKLTKKTNPLNSPTEDWP